MRYVELMMERYRPGWSTVKNVCARVATLALMSLLLGLTQGWAAGRTYGPNYVAGFETGILHGALMPAALPGLLLGRKVPIYAPNNSGNSYEIGYIVGINACGFFFFGMAFWRKQKRVQDPEKQDAPEKAMEIS